MKTLPKVTLKQVNTKSKGKKLLVSIKDKQLSLLELIKQNESDTEIVYSLSGNGLPAVIITITNPLMDFTEKKYVKLLNHREKV